LAKLITSAPDRTACIARSLRALGELKIGGIMTTAPFHEKVLHHPDFRRGVFDTGLVERMQTEEKNEEVHRLAA
jgi:acetyl-CoA carboxylase biotin carboxylase subunit